MDKFYIPTCRRVNRQLTWDVLPASWHSRTVLVCPDNEVEEHRRRGRAALGCPAYGIARTREWIYHHALDQGYRRICMLDDDIRRFTTRLRRSEHVAGTPWWFAFRTEAEWDRCLEVMHDLLDRTAWTGLTIGANPPVDHDLSQPWRVTANHWINVETLPPDLHWYCLLYTSDAADDS